jgi:hypothetical protein
MNFEIGQLYSVTIAGGARLTGLPHLRFDGLDKESGLAKFSDTANQNKAIFVSLKSGGFVMAQAE